MESQTHIFSSRDIYLSSTLMALGFPLLGLSLQQEGLKPKLIGFFEFENTSELREAKQKYHQGLIRTEPKALFSSLQDLKGQVMNSATNPDSDYHRAHGL